MNADKICALGRQVIEIEAQMILNLKHRINQNFVLACQLLSQCEGRIAVMGIGKSGHIGKKIAATFASTGSPAFFIHPSEAKHGDMGMLTHKDVMIALSYSGESEEIICLLPFIKSKNIPLIAFTGKAQSTLALNATLNLDVSVEKEACPLGLAPTSSTTAALVMGDALAMTLSENRGFTKNDFALSHPGGSLGRRLLLKIDEIMHKHESVPKISDSATLKTALVEMTQKKLGITSVVNQAGQLVGVFTDGDVRRAFDKNVDINSTVISELMSTQPKTIKAEILASDALSLMENHQITSLVVTDNHHHPIGIIHIHDILRAGVS